MPIERSLPTVLTIAGSDSGGGAGIQADIKTLTSLHLYATSVITSVTAQNTLGVDGIHDIPADIVGKQINAVLSDIGSNAIKIGMLSSTAIITQVAISLKQFPEQAKFVIVDPVMISTSGSRLLAPAALQALVTDLLPITYILTPNVPEAEMLLNRETGFIKNVEDMCIAAKEISTRFGPKAVLLKGGHLPFDKNGKQQVVDVVYDSEKESFYKIQNDYVETKNTHGTGCTLSAALAGELAKGVQVKTACENAIRYVKIAITQGIDGIGKGNGPINHFHPLRWAPYQNSLIEALKESLPKGLWSQFIDHPFVRGIADGTLPIESFIHYLKQDYLYLQHYARSAALAAYKSPTMDEIGNNASIVAHIVKESQFHLNYCEKFGVSKVDVLNTSESPYNSAYTRFVLDKGATGDMLDLKAAMAPCLLGYGEIGLKLHNDPATKREGNPYWGWICQYAASDYQEAVASGFAELEELGKHHISSSKSRFDEVCKTFEQGTRLEVMFWEMGLRIL